MRGFKVKNNIDQPQHSQHHGNDIGYSPNGRNRRTVWTIATAPYSGAHFATYPPKLVEPCIKAGSRVGDIVLDPFCGSGTTGAVAVENGRDFIGIELNPEYIKLSEERIRKSAMQGLLFTS